MTPREKIAAIFAKARSTTSPHERDNALTLGTRLADKAGLSLDLFDVPGRVRKAEPKPERPHFARGDEPPRHYNSRWSYSPFHEFGSASFQAAARADMAEQLAAMRKRFVENERRAAEARKMVKPRPLYANAEAAAAFLRGAGAEVYAQPIEPGEARKWSLIHGGRLYAGISDEGLIVGAVAVTPEPIKAAHASRERKRMADDLRWASMFV